MAVSVVNPERNRTAGCLRPRGLVLLGLGYSTVAALARPRPTSFERWLRPPLTDARAREEAHSVARRPLVTRRLDLAPELFFAR
jgi:hypothetical protein